MDTTKKEKSNRKKSYCSSKNHIGFDQDNLFSLYILIQKYICTLY